jgi:hypothetical protein
MKKALWAVSAAALAVVSTAAWATVTLTVNGDSATGFVGKGDVQSGFGLNNNQLQKDIDLVTFNFSDHVEISWTCSWVTGAGTRGEKTHVQDVDRSGSLMASFTDPSRKNGNESQGTGWVLNGSVHVTGSLNSIGSVIPVEGQTCQGDSLNGTAGTVSNVSVTETGGALTATLPGKGTINLDSSGIFVTI